MSEDPTNDENAEAAAAPPPPPPKPPRFRVLTIIVALNLAGTGGGVYLQLRPRPAAAAPAPAAPAAPPKEKLGPVVPMDPFVVNLNEVATSRYLKATFELEMSGEKVAEELAEKKRGVRDDVLRYLSGLTVADTLGEDNKNKIQEEIVARLNKQLTGGKVKRLYFADFVVQ